jgi:hypothetical protein|nr:MAG TPA: hypothetical protein [Caudoviricetes sp.]
MSRKAAAERWLIWNAFQQNNKKSAEDSVMENRAESIRNFSQSRNDFTQSRGYMGDYDMNPMLGLFSMDTSVQAEGEERKRKKQMMTGAP